MIVPTDTVSHLAQDPGTSDLEMFLAHAWGPATDNGTAIAPVLEEEASTTIDGVYASTTRFVELISAGLVEIWEERRADPTLVLQPRAQWPNLPSSAPNRFDGYRRGEFEYSPDLLLSNPDLHDRLSTSKLVGDFAAVWDALDGGEAP